MTSVHQFPNLPPQPVRLSAVPRASSTPPLVPSSFHCVHLPVCPATRLLWPPPCSVAGRRGFAVESAAARVRVSVNVRVQDQPVWRLWLVGFPCKGAQLERVCPELTSQRGRTRLVVLAKEVGSRWSEECREFLNLLAKAKAKREPRHLRSFFPPATMNWKRPTLANPIWANWPSWLWPGQFWPVCCTPKPHVAFCPFFVHLF